ncbi:MAG: endonuclease/exonuclease/phosphatase family protein [Chloroflexota bacterium]
MLTVATLNLRASANRWEKRFPLVVDTLRQTDAAIIALQEVRINIEQHQLLANTLNTQYDTDYSAYLCEDWYDPHIMGNGFLTSVPVLEHERMELPEGYRTAQRILVEIDGQPINIVNTHLHHKPYRDESIRLKQVKHIFDWLADYPQPIIFMGDMNARPESETVLTIKKCLQSAHETVHAKEPAITFPTPLRTGEGISARTIDYIFCDKRFDVQACAVIGKRHAPDDDTLYPSDHFGLCATIDTSLSP